MSRTSGAIEDLVRVPPCSIEAERAVLGAVLRENDRLAQVAEVVTHESMFYRGDHKRIWKAMGELYRRSEPIDLLTLAEELGKSGGPGESPPASYLSGLLDATPTAGHARHHAQIVRDKAVLRGVIRVGRELEGQAVEGGAEAEALLDDALKSLVNLRQYADPGGAERLDKVLHQVFADMEGGRRGLPTGFPDLDEVAVGLEPGNFVVVAARPSIGKTAFTLSVARYLAVTRREPVGTLYFYLEGNAKDLGYRLLAAETSFNLARLKAGKAPKSEWPTLMETAGRLTESPIEIDDTPRLTATQIRGRTWQAKARSDSLALVVVDHIGRMGVEDRRLGRERQVAENSAFLADMAKDLGLVVIALSQLNRECEARADKKPQLSDLRESGSIEQDADLVLLLHRPGHYVDFRERHAPTEGTVIVAKQRDGPTGEVKIRFNPGPCRFEGV